MTKLEYIRKISAEEFSQFLANLFVEIIEKTVTDPEVINAGRDPTLLHIILDESKTEMAKCFENYLNTEMKKDDILF